MTFGVGKAVRAGDDERENVFSQFRSDFAAPPDAGVLEHVVQKRGADLVFRSARLHDEGRHRKEV